MATVTLNDIHPTPPKLKYDHLNAGQYIIDNEGHVFAVVYNNSAALRPVIASVSNPSNTYTGGLPNDSRTYRLLEKGENFTVTI